MKTTSMVTTLASVVTLLTIAAAATGLFWKNSDYSPH